MTTRVCCPDERLGVVKKSRLYSVDVWDDESPSRLNVTGEPPSMEYCAEEAACGSSVGT